MRDISVEVQALTRASARLNADALTWVRRVGYGVLGLQLIGFLTWSTILYQRFALTWDFSIYHQTWYLIAHGNLDPYSTLLRMPAWQNDAEFVLWLLAPVYWLGRSDMLFPWLQDASIWGAELIVFTWLCDLVRSRCGRRDAALLAGLGLLLIVANPWIWWTASYDVHPEVLAMFFLAFLAWDLSRNKRRAWLWVVPALLGCAPTATFVVAIGLGGLLARRRIRDIGAAIAIAGVVYSLLVVVVHADIGVPVAPHYGYLVTGTTSLPPSFSLADLAKGIALHPLNVVWSLWAKRADIIANVGPSGLIGIGAPMIMPLTLTVLLENALSPGYQFIEPLFQSAPIYVLLPVGTVAVLTRFLHQQHRPWQRRASLALAGVLAAQAVGWAVVWGPRTPTQWLRVSSPAAMTLARVAAEIPDSAEVIASQGVIGRFSSRALVYHLFDPGITIPLQAETWVIVTPTSGTEALTPAASMALIGELAGPLHAILVVHANGVWAFRLTPRPGVHQLIVPDESAPLPAWAATGAAGFPVLDGQVSGWHMAATGAKGYITDGLEWQEPPGRYRAAVTLSAAGPVNVEVWDDTNDTLLTRKSIPETSGVEQVSLPVAAPNVPVPGSYAGWGPFHADFVSPPAGQRIEVRVWSSGGTAVNVYSAALTTSSGSSLP